MCAIRLRRLAAVLLSGLPLLGLAVLSGQDAPQKPSFRTAVALVPVNVSVVGPDGQPVLDLKKEDFTILEDGVPQEIRHFSLETLAAETSKTRAGESVVRRNVPVLELAPQQRRVFLVALTTWRGSGIQEPNKGLDALQEFVRTRLLPQDIIAVLAYNRATVFTTDHAAISEVIARYRARSEKIASSLEEYFSGLRAVYGSGRIPDDVQSEIDGVFDVPGASMRQMPAVDARPIRTGATPPIPDPDAPLENFHIAEMAFDDFVSRSLRNMQGLSHLFAGIQYMRNIEGQKRLLYIGPGMFLPSTDSDNNIAVMANDARVALDMIQAGGIEGLPTSNGRVAVAAPAEFRESFNFVSLRSLAEQTGGQSSIAKYTKPALDRVDIVTRTQYLVGYYPKIDVWNGKYRRIEVKVNRPNVEVVWRQGYYARQDRAPYDGKELLTVTRISSAARFERGVTDIKLKAEVRDNVATLTIDVSKIAFKKVDDKSVGQLRVAVFYGDAQERLIHQRWNTIDLNFTEEDYSKYLTTGVEYRCPVPTNLKPTYMKIVVYNYDADLLGSVEKELRPPGRRH